MLIKARESDAQIHIDFVPMVDVLFNLLVFFLLATSIYQAEREMRVALPISAAAGPITTALREIVVNVQADGRIILAGRLIDESDLRAMVTQAVATNPEQKVTVRGDRDATYASIVRVLDICKASKVQEPYLDTVLGQ